MAIEILDFPINSMVIFHCYVSSPEATSNFFGSAVPSSLIFFWMWFYIYVEKHDDSTRFQSQGPPKKTIQVLGHFSWGNQWCHIKPQASWPYEIATKRPDFQICDAVYGSHMHFFFLRGDLTKENGDSLLEDFWWLGFVGEDDPGHSHKSHKITTSYGLGRFFLSQ